MDEAELSAKVDQVRRLARSVGDYSAELALMALAKEYEAKLAGLRTGRPIC